MKYFLPFCNILKQPHMQTLLDGIFFKCNNRGCSLYIKYANVREHDLICPKLKITCIGCNSEILQENLKYHKFWL